MAFSPNIVLVLPNAGGVANVDGDAKVAGLPKEKLEKGLGFDASSCGLALSGASGMDFWSTVGGEVKVNPPKVTVLVAG